MSFKIKSKKLTNAGGHQRRKLILSYWGKPVASVVVESGGTVHHVEFANKDGYGGPQTARALAKLLIEAAKTSEELSYA